MYRLKAIALALALLCAIAYPSGSWEALSGTPSDVGECAGLAWASFPLSPTKDSVYLLHGHGTNNQNKFSRYDVSAGSWTSLANISVSAQSTRGGALCFTPVGDYERLYALSGDDDFLYYRPNTWYNLTSTDPFTHYTGCALTFGGTGTSGGVAVAWLYAFAGGSQTFKQYQFYTTPYKGGGSDASWTAKANYGYTVGDGAGLAFDTYDNDYEIYGTQGGNTQVFRGYSRANNSWTSLANTPSDVNTGGALAAYTIGGSHNHIYGLRGDASNAFWVYSISANDWSATPDDPTWTPGCGASIAYCPDDGHVYAVRGDHTTDFAVFDPSGDGGDAGLAEVRAVPSGHRLSCASIGRSFVMACAELTGAPAQFTIYDVNGRAVWQASSTLGAATWCPGVGTPAGSYVARAEGRNLTVSAKLVVTD
jgi:hypothetical protein